MDKGGTASLSLHQIVGFLIGRIDTGNVVDGLKNINAKLINNRTYNNTQPPPLPPPSTSTTTHTSHSSYIHSPPTFPHPRLPPTPR